MSEPPPPFRRTDLPVELRVDDLLGRMTLEEKIDQLHQCGASDTNPNNLALRPDAFRPTYGSFIVGGSPAVLEVRNACQRRVVTESRLGIPAVFAADVIHGYRALAPLPLAQACTWDPELVRRGCALAAAEARAQGIDWTFAPMVDHCVDARWGRIAETFGESPHAASAFSAASVRGFQGEQLGGRDSVAACLKHYVGYGASEGGRDYVYTGISPQSLWEMHLPPFEAGIRAGARTVMSGFNDLNGVPASANQYTLTEILRRRWGLTGPVVSDWDSVVQLVNQGFAADDAEAAEKAFTAGLDIDMSSGLYRDHLAAHVAAGRVTLAAVDEAVRRVLRLKFELGLFERPYAEANALTDAAPDPGQFALLEELAARSLVLLKNDGVLPLAASARRIALLGPLAADSAPLLGCWAQYGQPAETQSIAQALKERLPAGVQLRVEQGCSIQGAASDNPAAAVEVARESDLVILCVGEDGPMSGENASRTTLRLAGRQEELVQAVAATGKPIVLVLVSGRPLELAAFEGKMSAIVAAWAGGTRAAAALADTLLGRRNPSGRLAVTWPRTTGQIPLYHNMRPRGRGGDQGAYRDMPTTPLYEFAHGLGYTTFGYGALRLDRTEVKPDGRLVAEVTVTNTGACEGVETVFWFIRDPAASITRPLKELKHFEQASLAPGASRVFRFAIEPRRDLSFPDDDGRSVLEPGEIILLVGGQSASFRVTR
ncbi:MAG: glycoside hydrolase family 3 C-terminal domain-containing protein [Opitutae bacterium]|nr:glycoside hydrolase family 3 C-terminal domain-containing protein [Opitutae bacterium]